MKAAKDLMTISFLTVDLKSKVDVVIKLLAQNNTSCVIVTDKKKKDCIVGIISERDLIKKLLLEPKKSTAIKDLMTANVITIAPEMDFLAIQHVMRNNRIKQVPVVEKNKVIGVVEEQHVAQEASAIEAKNRTFLMYQTAQTWIIIAFLIFIITFFMIKAIK
jgi:CBS domain-containing protein